MHQSMNLKEKDEEIRDKQREDEGSIEEFNFYDQFFAEAVPGVWLNVIKKLDPLDKPAFSRACFQWHEVAATKISILIFPEVIPVLLKALPQKSLLQTRELCRPWKDALDSHFQNDVSNLGLQLEPGAAKPIQKHRNVFKNPQQIDAFLEDMKEHPGNPFPGRNISFCPYIFYRNIFDRGCVEYWRCIIQLLERFGNHVYYASMRSWGPSSVMIASNFLACFRDFVNHLPNVKMLYINAPKHLELFEEAEILRYLQICPLPGLEHLEVLKLKGFNHVLLPIVLNLYVVPTKLRVLILNKDCHTHNVLSETVPKLVNLETLHFDGNYDIIIDFLRSYKLPHSISPRLKELDLRIRGPIPEDYYEQLLSALQMFGETLINLKVISQQHPQEFSKDFKIALPNLRKLHLNYYAGAMQPFQQLKTLTHLEIVHPIGFEIKDLMCKPKIWELIPSLEIVIVDGWKRYKCRLLGQQARVLKQHVLKENTKNVIARNESDDDCFAIWQLYRC